MSVPLIPTPEQEAVVAYSLRPVRIAAGAGTGKTTTMALRLAALIEDGGVEPETALGITFTNKAAEELAERLRKHLPHLAGMGREVEVTTYHGFAARILDEFGPLVGFERKAQLVTPGYVRELLRQALATGRYRHLDLRIPRNLVDELALLAGRLSDHLRTPDDLGDVAPEYPDDVWAARLEMAEVLRAYERIKRRYDAVDYGDLILLAYRAVSDPAVAARLRDRYRVVLLDEYQDTNPAQRALLLQIFGHGFPVTAVGDPDQTIYEWRGASLQNFAAFPEDFTDEAGSPAATLTLSVNRRSARRIVDAGNAVKGAIGSGEGVSRMVPAEGAGAGTVHVSWFHDSVAEAHWLAGEVRRIHDEEGIPWRAIGVLFRKNRQIHLIREALQDAGVPVEVAALGGLLQVPEVADLHAWLRLIGRPDDAPSLIRILLGAHFRLGLGDLAPLAEWVRSRRGRVQDADQAAPGWAMLEAVDSLEETEGLTEETTTRLIEFRRLYRRLLAAAQGVTLVELCRSILDLTGSWAEVEALEGAARLSARLNLYRFLDLAEEWSPLEGRPSLDAFLDYLDLLDEDAGSEELDTARLSNEDAVSLLTIHRAKGLEWPVVFLPAVAAGTFPSSPHGGLEDPLRYPEVLPFELRLDRTDLPAATDADQRKAELAALHSAQEWRTAYVAVTRAAESLYLSGAFWYTSGRPKGKSPLYEMIRALPGTEIGFEEAEPGLPPAMLRIEPIEGAPDPHFAGGWREALWTAVKDPDWPERVGGGDPAFRAQMEQLRLVLDGLPSPPPAPESEVKLATSVTALVTYATCPKRYFWTDVDPLPRRPSPAARRGVVVHRRIELHNLGTVPIEELDGLVYDLAPSEATHVARVADPFTSFQNSRFASSRPRFVEVPFDLDVGGKARLRGRIDAIYEPEPGWWEIVDFKSGLPSTNPAARLQLQAYAVAAHEAGLATRPPDRLTVTFAYLGDGLTEVGEVVDRPWLDEAKGRLIELVDDILAEHWEPMPSPACHSCDYVRFCAPGRALTAEAGQTGHVPDRLA